jgi:endonuclease YncB( thermonuclease family)
MKLKIFLILLFLFSLFARPSFGEIYLEDYMDVTFLSCFDGDTCYFSIPNQRVNGVTVHMKGIDAPEIHGKCEKEKNLANEARNYTVKKLTTATNIWLKESEKGNFSSISAHIIVDGKHLGFMLLQKDLAVISSSALEVHNWCEKSAQEQEFNKLIDSIKKKSK